MNKIKLMKHCLITDNVTPDLAGTVLTVGKDIDEDRAKTLIKIGYAVAEGETKDKGAAPENKAAPAPPKPKGK